MKRHDRSRKTRAPLGARLLVRVLVPARHREFVLGDLEPLELLAVGPKEYSGGVSMLRKFSDQELTLTDAVGLHVMSARRVRSCWSTDFHLGLIGVPLVIHQH